MSAATIQLVTPDLTHQETILQIVDALDHLDKVTDEVFSNIQAKIQQNASKLADLDSRVDVADQKVKALAEDGFCVLPMNILNDKIFLVLWYWYFVLLILSLTSVVYWFYHMISPKYRLKHIERHLKGQVKGNKLKFLNKHFGDWFLLHQLYKNLDFNNFTQLVSNLCSLEEEEALKLRRSETFVRFDLPSEEECENK